MNADAQTLRQFDAAVQTLRQDGTPTLLQLARAAVAAEDAESAFLFSDDPADQWQGTGDVRDLDLWNAKCAARDAFYAALESLTGIDRDLMAKVANL